MWLQNGNGVYLRLKARRQGLALSLGADGMAVRRKEQGRGSEHAPGSVFVPLREEADRVLWASHACG
jgi:hypothetical protein